MQASAENGFHTSALAAPRHILVATDLTDSDTLIPYAVAQAKITGAHVTLVHAVLPSAAMSIEAGVIPYTTEPAIDRNTQLMLSGMAAEVRSQGLVCDIVAHHGFPADVVCETLSEAGADRLIVGSHGRGKIGQFALGSVAKELLARVDVPVFAVGPAVQAVPEHLAPRNILHPVSLLGDCRKRLSFAIDVARVYDARLTLLHVLDPDVRASINSRRTLEWAKNALTALVPPTLAAKSIETRVTSGRLVDEVLAAASETDADWIVLGVDGTFPFWRFVDSAAYRVLAAANRPVLTLRHDPHHDSPSRETKSAKPDSVSSVIG